MWLTCALVAMLLTAAQTWPAAVPAAPDDAPRIIALQMNETSIAPGSEWTGRIATTTNVASVEVRTESFSFNATRVAFGQFAFDQHVLDIVPQYKRAYSLHVIARNAAGAQDVRLIPIVLH
ncbi:MAG TPA: hypothetical protein VK702_05410 [Candidatus Acidoferrum sp.]|jgi:hypothetical protein|nr:hypothetical protein [Candidatus Acidoferrum sp.]